jgi:hypothetical protein
VWIGKESREFSTWDIEGNVDGQLQLKLAESLWRIFVVADRLTST